MPGPGKIRILDRQTDALESLLYNFDIAQHQLKPEHEEWLKYNIAGYLKRGGSIVVVGLASRTATDDFNKRLSQRRLDSVINFLRRESPNNFTVSFQLAMSEGLAEIAGARDGSEDEKWRGVLIAVWERPKPPTPPPPTPPLSSPAMVERRVYATFLADISQSGGADDRRDASAIADGVGQIQLRKRGQYVFDKKMKIPVTHVIRQIYVWPDTSGSADYGIYQVNMLRCTVDYEWGRRSRPYCILVNYMDRRPGGRGNMSDPTIALLTDAQADKWVNDPFSALWEMLTGNVKLRYVDYEDYKSGKY